MAEQKVDRGDEEIPYHDGEADLEELEECEPVAVLFCYSGADYICACAD